MATRTRFHRTSFFPFLLAVIALLLVLALGSRLSPHIVSDTAAKQNAIPPQVDANGDLYYSSPNQWQKALKGARKPSPSPRPTPSNSR